jgi:2,3,4,5-tetrahydropyridine-2-carboxylate N-succinyltransferase
VIDKIDEGSLRVAEPVGKSMPDGQLANLWKVNEWVKQAILLYFAIQKMETYTLPPF